VSRQIGVFAYELLQDVFAGVEPVLDALKLAGIRN
jgi:hypothetical protein